MTFEEFVAIIQSTSIELFGSEWIELEMAFTRWKEKQENEN